MIVLGLQVDIKGTRLIQVSNVVSKGFGLNQLDEVVFGKQVQCQQADDLLQRGWDLVAKLKVGR